MSVQSVPVANRPPAVERANFGLALGDANSEFHSPVLDGRPPHVAVQPHFDTSDSAGERRPPHRHNSIVLDIGV
jgi:hypothetical protein